VARRRRKKGLILLALAVLCSGTAHALEVRRLDVTFQGDRYVVILNAQLDAPPDAVGQVLKRYDDYPSLDPRILEARVLSREREHSLRLYTRMRGCLGSLMCRNLQRVEQVEERPDEILATAVLDQSDVRFGVTRSQWQPQNGGTALQYRLEIMPKFWVPRFFGRRLMLSTLREGTLSLFTNVEREARTGHVTP
jgi:hypothetical protein